MNVDEAAAKPASDPFADSVAVNTVAPPASKAASLSSFWFAVDSCRIAFAFDIAWSNSAYFATASPIPNATAVPRASAPTPRVWNA